MVAIWMVLSVAIAGDLYGKGEDLGGGGLYGKAGATTSAGAAIGKDLVVGEPITLGGVTIYPVLDRSAPKHATGEALGLAEAMGRGQLSVAEAGGSNASAEGGSFSLVSVVNHGKEPVYIMAGEVIRGGRQDRMITEDVVVPPESGPLRITVHCVEKGRWSDQAETFSYGGRAEYALRSTGAGSQESTWEMVAALNTARGESATGAYVGVGGPEWLLYRQQLHAQLAGQQQVVGAVIARGGDLVHAEMFGDPRLSSAGRVAALDGYARDAVVMGTDGEASDIPDIEEAAAFLWSTLAE